MELTDGSLCFESDLETPLDRLGEAARKAAIANDRREAGARFARTHDGTDGEGHLLRALHRAGLYEEAMAFLTPRVKDFKAGDSVFGDYVQDL